MTKPCKEVLKYSNGRKLPSMIMRCFNLWRTQQDPPILLRCDTPDCVYHKSALVWNGKELGLTLDHIDGVCGNDNPKNLRWLCPNCNSQNKKTLGGGNKGRVVSNDINYVITEKGGSKNYHLPCESAEVKITGGEATFHISEPKPKKK